MNFCDRAFTGEDARSLIAVLCDSWSFGICLEGIGGPSVKLYSYITRLHRFSIRGGAVLLAIKRTLSKLLFSNKNPHISV